MIIKAGLNLSDEPSRVVILVTRWIELIARNIHCWIPAQRDIALTWSDLVVRRLRWPLLGHFKQVAAILNQQIKRVNDVWNIFHISLFET